MVDWKWSSKSYRQRLSIAQAAMQQAKETGGFDEAAMAGKSDAGQQGMEEGGQNVNL